MKVGVIGAGYVGLVTAACLAEKGNDVVVMDTDSNKLESISQGNVPFYEPGLEELVRSTKDRNHLKFTGDLESLANNSDIIFIAVGTPQDESGVVNTKYVIEAADSLGKALEKNKDFKVIVMKSTVPPGTTRSLIPIISKYRDTYAIASNPEFLKEGTALEDFRRPDRIVIGVEDERAERLLRDLYSTFIRTGSQDRLMFMKIESSELTKYAANGMLATRIAYMNEMARLAGVVGADINEIRRGIGSDSRIGPSFLFPGPGYGGSCFPKDIMGLVESAREKGVDLSILESVHLSNRKQRYWLADSAKKYFDGNIKDKTLVLWGVTFKPNTDDIRESSSIYTTNRLLEFGAKIRVYDPEKKAIENFRRVFNDNVEYGSDVYEVLNGASGLLVVTDWDEFKGVDLCKVKERLVDPLVIDSRGLYSLDKARDAGIKYISLGRSRVGF